MRSAANAECEGKSKLPSRPRNSTAAKPCCSANVRIFCKSQAGQPKVENAIGRRAVSPAGTNAAAIAAPVSFFANSRRVVLMEPRLQQSLAQDYLCAGKVSKPRIATGRREDSLKTESWQIGAIAISGFAN